MTTSFDIVILGLSVTSSWGNGHATTYRSLIRGLADLGHRVLFLERDMPWYAASRDELNPPGAVTVLYQSVDELIQKFEKTVNTAQLVIVGSYVPDGSQIGKWVNAVAHGVTAFYDLDTPITLGELESGKGEHITPELIRSYDLYLSFTGGPTLRLLESRYGSPMARVLYCSVDPDIYLPLNLPIRWDLGYLGTYSIDRQDGLQRLLLEAASQWNEGRFVVTGSKYPNDIRWPSNVEYQEHLAPGAHSEFYSSQRFTLNITRAAMKTAGYSPSVRLFEASACAVPMISDWWDGLDGLFEIGKELLISENAEETLRHLNDISESKRRMIGEAGRWRILAEHTPVQRALQLESYLKEIDDNFLAHPAWRNRRHWEIDRRIDAGMASQQRG